MVGALVGWVARWDLRFGGWELPAVFGTVALIWWEYTPARGKLERFRVRMQPKWEAICAEHPIATPDQVKAALPRILSGDSPAYSVLAHGIGFTVLEEELGYSDDHHHFFSELDIEESIPEWEQRPPGLVEVWQPSVYITSTLHPIPGWELGISTPQSFAESVESVGKTHRVPLAVLPWVVLADYWDGGAHTGAAFDKRRQREKEAALSDNGWRLHDDCDPVWDPNASLRLEHKHFTVYHADI